MSSTNIKDFNGYSDEAKAREVAMSRVEENRLRDWDIEIYVL